MWHCRLLLFVTLGAAAALAGRSALFVRAPEDPQSLQGSKTLNVSCASNETCNTYNTRSTCVVTNTTGGAMRCSCALPVYPYPDTANDICQQWLGGAGDPCISSLDCWRDTSLFCNATAGPETGACACPSGKPNFFGGACYLDVPNYATDPCAVTAQCQAAFGEHTGCVSAVNATGTVCRCQDGAVFVSDACWLQHDLHQPCTETHECGTPFSECRAGECRCQEGWSEQLEPRTQQAVCVGAAAAAAAGPLLALVAIGTALRAL